MWERLIHIIPTLLDLLALFICIGALAICLWILPLTGDGPDSTCHGILRVRLWRLLVLGIAALTVSSIAELSMRAKEMSDRPFGALLLVVPRVLSQTHYGRAWLIRAVALVVLWAGWWSCRRRPDSKNRPPAFMLGAGALIALSRSISGHAADWGDLTLPELMDWLHLMAASVWGGGLLVLSSIVLPTAVDLSNQRPSLFVDITRRFSSLAGVALGVIVVTAAYNAWLHAGSFRAIWGTPYGRILIPKALLLLVLSALGALNRYTGVPLLEGSLGRTLTSQGLFFRLFISSCFYFKRGRLDWRSIVYQFIRRVKLEAILVLIVLILTAILLHEVPARYFTPVSSRHTMEDGVLK